MGMEECLKATPLLPCVQLMFANPQHVFVFMLISANVGSCTVARAVEPFFGEMCSAR